MFCSVFNANEEPDPSPSDAVFLRRLAIQLGIMVRQTAPLNISRDVRPNNFHRSLSHAFFCRLLTDFLPSILPSTTRGSIAAFFILLLLIVLYVYSSAGVPLVGYSVYPGYA